MKNYTRFLGFVVATMVTILVFAGCGAKPAYLKVINNYSQPITEVSTGWVAVEWIDVNVAPGSSQTFTMADLGSGGSEYLSVTVDGKKVYTTEKKEITPGNTTTVTLNKEGELK